MTLAKIIKDIAPVEIIGEVNLEIENIFYDSRQVEGNSLFICIEGFKTDGHLFIDMAVKNGARAVLIEKELEKYREDVTYIRVEDSRKAMAFIAAAFYNYPLDHLNLIGVTGTNGKTTTTFLIKSVLEKAGFKTGLIGTIKNIVGDKILPATRTTPESLDLYQLFAMMVDSDVTHVVMEVSSHALDLDRVIGMKFKVGVFTNISQDHLDYHKSFAEYIRAKSYLFGQLEDDGFAVINRDDQFSSEIIESASGQVFTYSLDRQGDIWADEINLTPRGSSFTIKGKTLFRVDINLTGLFNVYNALAAVSCGRILRIEGDLIKNGLESLTGVPGRFELVDGEQDFAVVVDYAHTPDGMENVLKTAREFVKGKILVVFGCGGDRDRGKRPLMGEMGARYGDLSILTSDNPRSEDPLRIIEEVEAGVKGVDDSASYVIIPDRREAINHAIMQAEINDMVIIFGKGHETYQIFRDKTIPFDDREVAREAIRERLKGEKR